MFVLFIYLFTHLFIYLLTKHIKFLSLFYINDFDCCVCLNVRLLFFVSLYFFVAERVKRDFDLYMSHVTRKPVFGVYDQ